MHVKELNLIGHYNKTLEYASFDWDVIQEAAKLLGVNLDVENVLDLGCGVGKQLNNFKNSVGIDYSRERIKIARRSANNGNTFICIDVYMFLRSLKHALTKFNINLILMFELLEHLENPEQVVRLARPLGPIFGVVPINMPYVAHLQVFESVQTVVDRFNISSHVVNEQKYNHMFFVIKKEQS
jgi:2-polyprenyl-3-methyl-5-hydroxy-6-metoxy-1,4-benzoquinol methylase